MCELSAIISPMTPNISASKRAVKCLSSGRSITIGCCVVKATAKDLYTQRVSSRLMMCWNDEHPGTLAEFNPLKMLASETVKEFHIYVWV